MVDIVSLSLSPEVQVRRSESFFNQYVKLHDLLLRQSRKYMTSSVVFPGDDKDSLWNQDLGRPGRPEKSALL